MPWLPEYDYEALGEGGDGRAGQNFVPPLADPLRVALVRACSANHLLTRSQARRVKVYHRAEDLD